MKTRIKWSGPWWNNGGFRSRFGFYAGVKFKVVHHRYPQGDTNIKVFVSKLNKFESAYMDCIFDESAGRDVAQAALSGKRGFIIEAIEKYAKTLEVSK